MVEILIAAQLLLSVANTWEPQPIPPEYQRVNAIHIIDAGETVDDYFTGRESYIAAYNLSNYPVEAELNCEFYAGGNYIGQDSTSLILGPRQWRILILYRQHTNLEVTPICYVNRSREF